MTVDKEAILVKNLVPDCFNTDFEAKEYLVHVWDEILNAMDEYSASLLKANDEMGKLLMFRDGDIEQFKQKLPQRVIEGL